MNTCKHCGFTGEPEEFRYPGGSVCKKCRKEQNRKCCKKYQRKNHEQILVRSSNYYRDNHKEVLKKNRAYNEKRRRKNGGVPWTEIKNLRLGLYVEKVVASMFGVPTEAFGTPGVDFICPNGYKIQVKVSSMSYIKSKNPVWRFHIRRNKMADYFILVTVNNTEDIDKEDFKPNNIWMMKGNVLNNKTGTSVTPSTIHKWEEYSIMEEYENKFIACCTAIKGE